LSFGFGNVPVHSADGKPGRGALRLGGSFPARLLQRKLEIGEADDPLEREADRIADQVQGAPGAGPRITPARIQALGGDRSGPAGAAPFSVGQVLRSPGQPLDPATRSFFEPRFGHDFSRVRVHTDGAAARSAEEVGARAYAVGSHLVFSRQRYAPHSAQGQRLLAHELTHVVQQRAGQPRVQRDKAPVAAPTTAPPGGGNILYIGMNSYAPEVAALKARYGGTRTKVTTITRAEDSTQAVTSKGTFDLTADAGVDGFAGALGLDAGHAKSVGDLLKAAPNTDRDDMAHVIDVYAQTDGDGKDRMSRVVLSGHSYGTLIYGHAEASGSPTSHLQFDFLVKLAGLFPNAAAQTRHLIVSSCLAGSEENVRRFFLPAYPNLITFTGYTMFSPTGQGSASEISNWSAKTDSNPTKLAKPADGKANWASGVYQGDSPLSATETMTNLRADEPKFNEYLSGARADPTPHVGWLTNYYAQARGADLRPTEIAGPDHDYAHLHAEQSFRLRYWAAQVANFWKTYGAKVQAGYGTAPFPHYGTISRKDAVKAIADFPGLAAGGAAEKAEALRLLTALQDLDEKVMSADWLAPP
jgi:hypothetical protein